MNFAKLLGLLAASGACIGATCAQNVTPIEPCTQEMYLSVNPVSCDSSMPSCIGLPLLEVGCTWIASTPSFVPDRRPVVQIHFYNGSYSCASGTALGNPRGIGPEFQDGDEDGLNEGNFASITLGRLSSAYDVGWRRINLYLPAGAVRSQAFSTSQWWSMPEWKREFFAEELPAWIADGHEDVSISLYLGFNLGHPYSLCTQTVGYNVPSCASSNWYYPCAGAAPGHVPDPHVAADVCDLYRNIKPWMDAGVFEFWFDASAGHPRELEEFAYSAPYLGIAKFGGEAIPLVCVTETLVGGVPTWTWSSEVAASPAAPCTTGARLLIDGQNVASPPSGRVPHTDRVPWVANFSEVEKYGPTAHTAYEAATTEVGLLVNGIEIPDPNNPGHTMLRAVTLDEAWLAASNGYVLWSTNTHGNDPTNNMLQKIYSFGVITGDERADFDNDGDVDVNDYNRFIAKYYYYVNVSASGYNYVHGDMDGDGSLTPDDVGDFITLHTSTSAQRASMGHDYGVAKPQNVWR